MVDQIGNHTVKSGSTFSELDSILSVGEAEFYAVPMKIEIQSDSSTSNSLTDRLGVGQRTKHIDTRYFWIQERVQDGDLSIKKVLTAKNCAVQYHNNIASLQDWYSTDRGSHTPLQDEG